ncbi:division/cell wall cluster transcriptional repressor MraZ [bacterium]|nr:division/cell wall cluster transcriptional repressor MraZ [bacterium]
MFSGRYDHTIDEKGRVSIPARFREVLQRQNHDRLYITNFIEDSQRCLDLYPPAEWERVIRKFEERRSSDRASQLFETFYVGGAYEVPVDRQGRILIPPKLRDFAGLGHEVTFSAKHNRFQLWERARLDQILHAAEEQLVQDPEFLNKIGIVL